MKYKYYQGVTRQQISAIGLFIVAVLFAIAGSAGVFTSASARGNSQGGSAERGNSLQVCSLCLQTINIR
jgi:hypothetical protein